MYKKLSQLKSVKIALLGAGIETLSLAKFFFKHKIAADLLEWNEQRVSEHQKYVKNILTDPNYLEHLQDYDLVLRSPGFPIFKIKEAIAKFSPSVQKKILVSSPIELFMNLSPAKIIGVTGTKGKGTTSSLIFQMLKNDQKDVYLAGNIGLGAFDVFDRLSEKSWVILELSSFQLEDMSISPQVAVMLEISPDHLKPLSATSPNYHETFLDYLNAKANILKYQKNNDWAVINYDHKYPREFAKINSVKKYFFSTKQILDEGAMLEKNNVVVKINQSQFKIDISKRLLLGDHNLENILASTMVGAKICDSQESIKQAIICFKGLPHRLEKVYTFNSLTFIDDSYATGPAASIAAIKAVSKDPFSIILGGSSKGADFSQLAQVLTKSPVENIALIGEEAPNIAKALDKKGLKVYTNFEKDFDKAIMNLISNARESKNILLSPACASTDMFKNATERGDKFTQLAKKYCQ